MYWLLHQNELEMLRSANAYQVSAEEKSKFEATLTPTELAKTGDVVSIPVSGVLTEKPNFIAQYFGPGNTTYKSIIEGIALANNDKTVKAIHLQINSGGGQIDGLYETAQAIKESKVPVVAYIDKICASSAYWIASQCEKIITSNVATRVGSIGVAASLFVNESKVDIASSDAPKKRPDLTTDAGKKIIQEELDDIHELFVNAISEGRGVNKEKINADFGKGGMLMAEKALKVGMIDAIESQSIAETKSAASGNNTSGVKVKMNIEELKAQHPETYAAAVEAGINQERDRVNGHLILGSKSGDMKTAIQAVGDGSVMTATLTAKYMAAGMDMADKSNRASDDVDVNAQSSDTEEEDFSADVLAGLYEKAGIDNE